MADLVGRMRSEGAASLIRRVALQRGRAGSEWLAEASFYDHAQGLSADAMYACRVFEWQVHADVCNRRKSPGQPLEIPPWNPAHGPAPIYDAPGCVDIVVSNPYQDELLDLTQRRVRSFRQDSQRLLCHDSARSTG
jgi:hypothetical protein